ncbi:MAG: hypothetical protein ACRDOS_17030 [Gaiellaceae bacterium]
MLSKEAAELVCVDCGYSHDLDRPCPEPASRRSRADPGTIVERASADQRLLRA